MTVTAEHGPLAEIAEEELINAFMSRDGDGDRGIEHPLLLAMLMRRRRGEREGGIGDSALAGVLLGRH